jgi:hypothetical protein
MAHWANVLPSGPHTPIDVHWVSVDDEYIVNALETIQLPSPDVDKPLLSKLI